MIRRIVAATFAIATLTLSSTAQGQIRASERSTISQTIDGTTIAIDYGRPRLRGRTELWGNPLVVPWGKKWTPGANWATNIQVDKDITINGHALPEGHYSMWLEVKQDAWTAIFDPDARRFHLQGPSGNPHTIQFDVQPETGNWSTEVLTFSFPEVKPTGSVLRLAWDNTHVDFDIGVQASRPIMIAADLAERYVGSYDFNVGDILGGSETVIEITYENERLVVRWPEAPLEALKETWLQPLGEGMFHPVEIADGEILDILTFVTVEFRPFDGKATGFEWRALRDALWAEATRR